MDTTRILEVRVANGDLIRAKGECKDLLIKMQGKYFLVDLHVLTLRGCDVVLATQWLSTLGLISWDFKQLEMEFLYQGMKVWLQGVKSTSSVIEDGEQFLKQSDQKGLFL